MLTIDEAFRKFKSRLELNDKEQANASARQQEVRDYLDTKFKIDRSFLTGSYARWTKTKPLKDVDIFFVLKSSEDHYRSKAPSVVLNDFHDALVEKYGDKANKQNRSINVDFGVKADADDNTDYRVISVDVVPAFDKNADFEIPDNDLGKWIKTNPQTHAEKATKAHQAYSSEWKGLVRMVKYWNNNPKHGEKPVKPSFLIEVMALQCLHGGGGWQLRPRDSELLRHACRPDPRRVVRPRWSRSGNQQWNGCGAQSAGTRSSACGRARGHTCYRLCAPRSERRGSAGLAYALRSKVSAVMTDGSTMARSLDV